MRRKGNKRETRKKEREKENEINHYDNMKPNQ